MQANPRANFIASVKKLVSGKNGTSGLHMTNLVVGTEYSIQGVYSLSDTNWVEILSFEATKNNEV